MTFVLLYGPPAVGKLTVARVLAEQTGFKLFDNHASLDLAERIFARGTPSFARIVGTLRQLVFEEAAKAGVDLIFTYAYAHPDDAPELRTIIATVEAHGGRVQLVHLTCDEAVLKARVGSASRGGGKITEAGVLEHLLHTYDLFTPYPERPSLKLDTTHTPAHETAAAIAAQLERL